MLQQHSSVPVQSVQSTPLDANRTYQDRDGSYHLPNDADEHQRLDFQALALEHMMHGRVLHAPVSAARPPRRILDIGCGTGAVTRELARRWPEARVVGLDVSAAGWGRHAQPANVEFVQGDFMKMVSPEEGGQRADKGDGEGSDKDVLAPGSFDYVFCRLLIFGVKDWAGFAARIRAVLRPGGWAELHENEPGVPRTADGQPDEATVGDPRWRALVADTAAMGIDMCAGSGLAGTLRGAGFAGVADEAYRWPLGEPPSWQPEAVLAHRVHNDYIEGMLDVFVDRVCRPRRSPAELRAMHAFMAARAASHEPGSHIRFYAVVGQKPDVDIEVVS